MTQGDLVMSMDQLLTKPRLGTCHKFYLQPFSLASGETPQPLPLLRDLKSPTSVSALCFQMKPRL